MNTKAALDTLKSNIHSASVAQFADIVTILELGAGNLFLPDRLDKVPSVLMELSDAIVYSTCDSNDEYQPDAPFTPAYSGQWELVLASLVIAQDWTLIAQTAAQLRTEHPNERPV